MNVLDAENYLEKAFVFRERQAGVSTIYDGSTKRYVYNAYCLEKKLLKELVSKEYNFLDDALDYVNGEFGSWDLELLAEGAKKGCGNCAAK
jgi:hypothetical protein